MRFRQLPVAVVLCSLLSPYPASASICGVLQDPRPLEILKTESHYIWDLQEGAELWASRTDSAVQGRLRDFEAWISRQASTDQRRLLEDQRIVSARAGLHGMVHRHDLLLSGAVGKISRASCLERFLFGLHITSFGPEVFPAEFSAYVLRSKSRPGWLRIYLSFGDGYTFESTPAWSRAFRQSMFSSPPQNPRVVARAYRDIADLREWEFLALVHSHPFMFRFPQPHVGGTLLPSDADIEGWLHGAVNFGMREAWITNGIDTIRIPAAQFRQLAGTLP